MSTRATESPYQYTRVRPPAPMPPRLFSRNLPRCLQERFAGEHDIFSLDQPLVPDDPLHIDQEKGPLGDPVLGQVGLPDSPPYWRVTCISGKSLRRYGNWSDSANVL